MKRFIRRLLRRYGLDVVSLSSLSGRPSDDWPIPPDLDEETVATWHAVKDYTLTSPERISALCHSIRYLVENQIPGAIVECGVWRGGSVLAAVRTLLLAGDTSRDVYMFDTFKNAMPKPGNADVDWSGASVVEDWKRYHSDSRLLTFTISSRMEDVRSTLASTGYPPSRLKFVKGLVEQTVPDQAPEQIALLRLDTDWYESTHHELIHLYARLVPGGILIIDDYGHFKGARKAVDEYFAANAPKVLLNRIDYTGRLVIKPDPSLGVRSFAPTPNPNQP